MIDSQLLEIAEQSTQKINNGKFDYYYHCGDYKFYNSYLAHWYSQKTGLFPRLVSVNVVNQIKKQLEDGVDLNYDYNQEYLNKLKNHNKPLHLFLSGGTDSSTVLQKAHQSGIVFDEIISVIFGTNIKSKENLEVYKNAIPFAEKYKEAYKKFTVLSITEDDLDQYYSDPLVLFKTNDYENSLPFFRQFWNQSKNISAGTKIFSVDKPSLMFYNNHWYTILFDQQLSSHNGVLSNFDILRFWIEPENIKSYVKDSINYRNFLIENKLYTDKKLQFFKMSNKDNLNFNIINRIDLINQNNNYDKLQPNNAWNTKDQLSLNQVIKNQNVSLLTKYFTALNNLVSVYKNYNQDKSKLFDAQIAWAINIDTLEVFSQEELIPDGFKL